jgi:hypothetical protein
MNHIGFNLANTTSTTICNPNSYAIQIIDESVTRQPNITVEAVSNPHFRSFITSVTSHVLSKFVGMKPCPKSSDNEPMIKLVFVRLPLVMSRNKPIAPAPSLNATRSNTTRRLDSPWVKFTITRSPKPFVRGVFLWNERQFLFDQALMSGSHTSPSNPLVPIDERTFGQFVKDYTDSVLLAASPEAQSAAQASISKRLPPEILWLFRQSGQSTRGPFYGFVMSALKATIDHVTEKYIDISKSLVDQCFASAKTEIRYKSVLDLKNVFILDQYRINRLH